MNISVCICTPYIQTLNRRRSESMVNRTHINSAQSIFFGISPVVKQYHPLPSFITCWGVVSWFSGWYWFYHMSLSQSESIILNQSIILHVCYTVHQRFWLASYERLNIRSTKYKHKYSLKLDCFETKRDVDVYLIVIQNNI